jgi:hypothetical protein
MEGKDIYIVLVFALLCWRRPVTLLATPYSPVDNALLAMLTATRPIRTEIRAYENHGVRFGKSWRMTSFPQIPEPVS